MAELIRTLRLRDLVFLIIGSVIGSGIFLVPGTILRQVNHSVGVSSLVWIAGGVLSLLGALSYGELAAMRPEAGGLYVYIREGFGPLPAFLYVGAMIASGNTAGTVPRIISSKTRALPWSSRLSSFRRRR